MFAQHLRVESHCDRSLSQTDEPIKGLENLIQKIRSPPLPTNNPSEEDMWKVIYTNLFPSDDKDDIPNPCERSPLPSSPTTAFFSFRVRTYQCNAS